MTIDCVRERLLIIRKLWKHEHNVKTCNILLQQLRNDITFFVHEPVSTDEIDKLQEEINEDDRNK